MPEAFKFDVFISYSHKDEAWVIQTLLPKLESAGLKVCIDFRNFRAGRASILNMQDAVRTSQRTLLVLTPNWFGSEWTFFESILGGRNSPAGLKERLIPVLLESCEFPPDADFIANLTYVDFTRHDRLDNAWLQLLTALGKPPDPTPPKEPQRDDWYLAHPYPMPPNFTGRLEERQMLTKWLETDPAHPLLVLRALGGFGKSALTWHWLLHDVKPTAWPRAVWWSFYEADAGFDQFLTETLNYLTDEKTPPENLTGKNAVKELLKLLRQPGTLLVLDGFERLLRAFGGLNAAYQGDNVAAGVSPAEIGRSQTPIPNPNQRPNESDRDCLSPLAEDFLRHVATQPTLHSKVLLTTRLFPRILEAKGGGHLQGCREEELKQMQPADAVAFFQAQGIRGTHTEIEQACLPYGYHPLSLRLLAGLIVGDFQQPGDIAAAKRLDVSGDLIQRQNHVLQVAYDTLTPERQGLLSQIACFRSPVKYEALKALANSPGRGLQPASRPESNATPSTPGTSNQKLDTHLRDLISRGLLNHDPKERRFDLHPIVRRYAYDRLAALDRTMAHTLLRDYFAAVPVPKKVTRPEDLASLVELYHQTVRAGQFESAADIFHDRLINKLLHQFGAYQVIVDLLRALFPDGEDQPPRLDDESAQAWVLTSLATAYGLSGRPSCALPLLALQISIREKQGDRSNLAIGLGNLAQIQIVMGAMREAETKLRLIKALCRELDDKILDAIWIAEFARLLAFRGSYAECERYFTASLRILEDCGHFQSQGLIWAFIAQKWLLRIRSTADFSVYYRDATLVAARLALELADKTASDPKFVYPVRDYVRAHWMLGAAYLAANQHGKAEHHLHDALERCRRINMVDHEADILIDLARLNSATNAPAEAQRHAEEALLITERSGYVLQGADAHLELAKLALARNDKATAKTHASEALHLATCDGPPDYTYHAAYTEAIALLKELAS